MPRIKNEPADSSSPKGTTNPADDELMDERFELACVEESVDDDANERSFSAKFVSSLNSPQYGAHGEEEEEEETAVDLNMEEEEDGQKHNKRRGNRRENVNSDEEESGEVGPKTPPDGEEKEEKSDENGTNNKLMKSRKRRHSSARRSQSKDSLSSSYSRDESESSRNSSSSYRGERKLQKYDGDRSVDDRIRQNKQSRLIRLRNARSRQLGYEYIPPLSKSSRAFPPQPYFKNPSYYPGEQRDKTKPLAPPPPAQRIAPLPGGRLPLVQRRSSPAPFELSSRQKQQRSPPPGPTPSSTRWRRTIVEDTIRVTAKRSRSPSPRSSSSRRSPSSYSSNRSSSRKEYLGPQTLYPSRRDPYPPSYRPSNGRDYDRRSSSYKMGSSSYSSSESNGRGMFIFTGTKYVPRPFIPPPPPGKKWNCPRREKSATVGEKKWNCPKREHSRTPPRR